MPFGALGAGLSIVSPAQRIHPTRSSFNSLAVGGLVEAGYRVSKAVHYSFEDREADPPVQRIRVEGADLGTLPQQAPYLRFGLFARF